ncbi:MAG TPA: ankyrin repeat domain-containing protein [Vicinamibacterales bacterium]|nr:ankyrin repeat domain-containing protein [Vicinamibacterales bacterium]
MTSSQAGLRRGSGVAAKAGLAMSTFALIAVAVLAAAEGDLRLVDAARQKDQQAVRALLKQRADVNVRARDGSTALLWAAHWNDLDTADLLIKGGADANAANDLKTTPLSLACTNANAALVDRLLAAGANPNTPIATGETPLITCAGTGSADAVRALIARGADVNAKEPSQNQTALMWAAAERHADVVKLLIEHKADLLAHTKKGFTALHFAAREGDLESAKLLLGAGVDINIRSQPSAPAGGGRGGGPSHEASVSAGSTPLLVATMRAHVPFALFLLEQGADPNASDAGMTPLHWAAGTWESGEANPVFGFTDAMSGIPERDAKLQLVKALLARGANPNVPMTQRPPGFAGGHTDVIGATPFLLASAAADMEMMRLLLAAGADPKRSTKSNMTPIAAATGVNRVQGESNVTEKQAYEVVKFLIELGVDPKTAVSTGENAIFGAAYRGWSSVVQLLADHGTDVNAISKSGTTPWRAAAGQGDRLGGVLFNTETAALLVKLGADPTLGKPCMAQTRCR